MKLLSLALVLLVGFSGIFTGAGAQQRTLSVSSTGSRVALVIGNDSYSRIPVLRNARTDATAMADALRSMGFEVILRTDLGERAMREAVRGFKMRLTGGSEAVFYYAGHGMQIGAANYLLPVDIQADNEEQIRDDALALQRVLDDLTEQKVRFSVAIIDACRDNPFPRTGGRSIGGTRGLAPTTAATGQMVLFSAGAGQSALDKLNQADRDPNGLFTRVLLKQIQQPGVPVDQVLKRVRAEVVQLARSVGHEQVPALYDQSIGEFFFRPGAGPQVAVAPSSSTNSPAVDPALLDLSFWDSIKTSTNRADFEEYLRQFPAGRFAGLARNRLQGPPVPAASVTPVTPPAPVVAPAQAGSATAESEYQRGVQFAVGSGGVSRDDAEAVRWFRRAADKGHLQGMVYLGFMQEHGRGMPKNEVEAGRLYRRAAEQGDAAGQNNLGVLTEQGRGVAKDEAEAARWYRRAADQNNANAQANLGYLHDIGRGVAKDDAEALRWYRKAADQNHARGMYLLGTMYENGQGVTKDDAEAARWYRKSADLAYPDAQTSLGVLYEHGRGVSKDDAEAARWYRRAADLGHARGQGNLGYMYDLGRGVGKNDAEALRWYRLSADQNHPRAIYLLGTMHENGQGVAKDEAEAARWYRKAADLGYADAQTSLGVFYELGRGVAKDEAEAARWYRKAADQGNARAQAGLGYLYDFGRGVAKNDAEALRWYRRSADQNFARGQVLLGTMYENGQGVARDYAEAARWYRKAADQGHADGQANLAVMYENGKGVAKDMNEALRWYRRAAQQGNARAQTELKRLGAS